MYGSVMKKVTLITVGKIKTRHWLGAVEHYRKNLHNKLGVAQVTVKDGSPDLPPSARMRQEGERLLAALQSLPGARQIFCLDEYGDTLDSRSLAALLDTCWLKAATPCFIIGGAYGLDETIRKSAAKLISLSRLTFTHELAQVIFWEQLFRADAIQRNSGYHHG